MTITIEGRNRFANEAKNTIEIRRVGDSFGDPLFIIEGGDIEQHADGNFVLTSKHESATDEEHDASYVAYFEGAGLQFQRMSFGTRVEFTGVLLSAQYYENDADMIENTDWCEGDHCNTQKAHPFLSFTPPNVKWKPANYSIIVNFKKPKKDGE